MSAAPTTAEERDDLRDFMRGCGRIGNIGRRLLTERNALESERDAERARADAAEAARSEAQTRATALWRNNDRVLDAFTPIYQLGWEAIAQRDAALAEVARLREALRKLLEAEQVLADAFGDDERMSAAGAFDDAADAARSALAKGGE